MCGCVCACVHACVCVCVHCAERKRGSTSHVKRLSRTAVVTNLILILSLVQNPAEGWGHLPQCPVVHSSRHDSPHRLQLQGNHLLLSRAGEERHPLLYYRHKAIPPSCGRKVSNHLPHVVISMSSKRSQRLNTKNNSWKNREIIVSEVKGHKGGAERESGGQGGEGVSLEEEGVQVLESADRGREVGELGVAEIENS